MGRDETSEDIAAAGGGKRRRRLALIGLMVFCCALAAAAVVRTLAGSNDGDDTAAAASNRSTTASTASTGSTTAALPSTASPTTTSTAAETTGLRPAIVTTVATVAPASSVPLTTSGAPAATTTVAVDSTPASPAPADTAAIDVAPAAAFDPASLETPIRWAVFDAGRVSLLGRIPTRAAAETIARKAAAIVGADNVLVGYTIDPAAPLVASGPLFVADTVLFASESARIGPEFQALLDLGRALLANNPKVSITVIGRSDSQGDPAYNLRLSQQRAQAAVDYLVDGIDDPGRVGAIGLGADAPVADDGSDAGRQLNRSVTFVITGLLDE